MLTPTYLPTSQSEACPPADHALLLEHCKTHHYPLQDGTHGLEGISPCGPLCLAKQESFFFLLHPKLCLRDLTQHWCTKAEFRQQSESLLLRMDSHGGGRPLRRAGPRMRASFHGEKFLGGPRGWVTSRRPSWELRA